MVIELFLTFIDRELESEIKSRRDMQRRQPGTHSMQKQGTSSAPFYGFCANEKLVISTKTNAKKEIRQQLKMNAKKII